MKAVRFAKDYQLLQGLLYSLLLSQLLLGVRIQQGQWENIYELAVSQLAVFSLLFANWISNQFFIRNQIVPIQGFHAVLSLCSSILLSILYHYFNPFQVYRIVPLIELPLHMTLVRMIGRGVLIYILIYPLQYYLFHEKKKIFKRLNMEKEKQEALNLRLAFLGQQLDPHFLFNSLAVLRAGTDDPWVKSYVNRLAKIYQYSLQKDHNDGLALVMDEIEFTNTYLSLFQERFEDALNIHISVDGIDTNAYLPRLALQLLAENALKHNQFTLQHPLQIEIYNEGEDILVVKNNIRQHTQSDYQKEPSGIGLKNLQQRYKLLQRKKIEILQDDQHYIVKIPIIKKGLSLRRHFKA